jgi:hypothetical protein
MARVFGGHNSSIGIRDESKAKVFFFPLYDMIAYFGGYGSLHVEELK